MSPLPKAVPAVQAGLGKSVPAADSGSPAAAATRPTEAGKVEAFPSNDRYLQWLAQHIATNRFIPVPPPDRWFVGDGDFRAIGAEFLRYFVQLGGLRPTESVLEIGCGIGRMALPLTQYLTPDTGRYEGMDIVKDGIDWCSGTISAVYGNFGFRHLDLFNDVYNPGGRLRSEAVTLPYESDGFDFVILTSVLTHLRMGEARTYIGEIARLLRPAGRCFLSLFLMNAEARAALRNGPRRLTFDPEAPGPEFLADRDAPSSAVAYDEDFLLEQFGRHGLRLVRPILHGHWSGRESASYQDLCVVGKEAGAVP